MLWAPVLALANVLADMAIGSPMLVLPELMVDLGTDEAAWLSSSAMLAGAIWSPLLARSSDVFGKRRVLVVTLLLSGVGALICFVAPTLVTFLVGRFLQGVAFAAIFVTVALAAEIYPPPRAMAVIGVVTSVSSIVGIVEPLLMQPVIEAFGHRSVFLVAALLAVVAAAAVRAVIPESSVRGTGRVDVLGALLLGGGLGAVLGWLTGATSVLLPIGVTLLTGWALSAWRAPDPIIDIRALHRPILLTLLAVVLAAGAFRSMLHLTALRGGDAVALLMAAPNLGILLGGVIAGWVAGRIDAESALLGGIIAGTAGTFGMLASASALPIALGCGLLMGIGAGAVGASGYNLAISFAAPRRHGSTAGLVSVVTALGSVFCTFAGNELLKVDADTTYLYVILAGGVFAVAAIPAVGLTGFAARIWAHRRRGSA